MEIIRGKAVVEGIAIGKLYIDKDSCLDIRDYVTINDESGDYKTQIERYESAKKRAVEEINKLYYFASEDIGQLNASVFKAHIIMIEDEAFTEYVHSAIRNNGLTAEGAILEARDHFASFFEQMEDEYFRARSMDVKDISARLIRSLDLKEEKLEKIEEPVVIAGVEITPSVVAKYGKDKALAVVTHAGSKTSHAAIFAKTMNIPAIMDIEILPEWNGKMVAVDGFTGNIYIEPDAEIIAKLSYVKERFDDEKGELESYKGRHTVTSGGRSIKLYANINGKEDVETALLNDAEGIGLFRTEYLCVDRIPTEEEQFEEYKAILETMDKKKVIIRAFDVGADKKCEGIRLEHEENPALGLRGIRLLLSNPKILKSQLKAILRAACYGNVAVMFPMIISSGEVREAKAILKEAKEELEAADIDYKDVEIGAMIETPAAALVSGEIAAEVDFISIGTNDLIQYTLALDRQNEKLDSFYNPYHEAVKKLMEMTIENAHNRGKWVGICGELGSDEHMTEFFLRLGVDEISVPPQRILSMRKIISMM